MAELGTARIISLASAEPGLTGSPLRRITLASDASMLIGAVSLTPSERQSSDILPPG
jgi:hypothetical protein